MNENTNDLSSKIKSSEVDISEITTVLNRPNYGDQISINTNIRISPKEITEFQADYASSTFDYLAEKQLSEEVRSNFNPTIGEGTVLKVWKLIETVSAKLIDFYDNIVVLECLIDRENQVYEEREFENFLFEGFTLELGKYFKVCKYRKSNQVMLEIKDKPGLILESDFPVINIAKKFGHIQFTKKGNK